MNTAALDHRARYGSRRPPRELYLLAGILLGLPAHVGLLSVALSPPEPEPVVCRCEAPAVEVRNHEAP